MSLIGDIATAVPKALVTKVVGGVDDGARYADLLADLGQVGVDARPVVIQGGYSTSGYMYEALQELLRARGFTDVSAASLPLHGYASFQRDAKALAKAVRAASERSLAAGGDGKVTVIAHSKGGLTARWMLQRMDMLDSVSQLVTLGTPHNGFAPFGTKLARVSAFLPNITASRQLLGGSRIIRSLNAELPAFMARARGLDPDFRMVSIAGDVGGLLAGTDTLISTAGARLDDRIDGVWNLVFAGEGANHLAIAGQTGAFEPTLRAATLLSGGSSIADAARGATFATSKAAA